MKKTNIILIVISIILLFFMVRHFCLAVIDMTKLSDSITKEQIANEEFSDLTVKKYSDLKRDDCYEFNYKIKTLEKNEKDNDYSVIDKELYYKTYPQEWNDCRNSGMTEDQCYNQIRHRIIEKVKNDKQAEENKIKNIKAEIEKEKNFVDHWAEFDSSKLEITDDDLNGVVETPSEEIIEE